MLLREYIRTVLEGDDVRFPGVPEGKIPNAPKSRRVNPGVRYDRKFVTRGGDGKIYFIENDTDGHMAWWNIRPADPNAEWPLDPESSKPVALKAIAALVADADPITEWHTDLENVMSTEEDIAQHDLENPARTDMDLQDPYAISNVGLKTTRGPQHAKNLGHGAQSGRQPGGKRQGITGRG
jgi:hypothetical protein